MILLINSTLYGLQGAYKNLRKLDKWVEFRGVAEVALPSNE
jgi:hypothetical protein